MSSIWRVEWDERARRELRKLDSDEQRIILKYFRKRIATALDPRRFGKELQHDLKGLWRYRIGEHRALCQIQESRVVVLVVAVGHRKNIYR